MCIRDRLKGVTGAGSLNTDDVAERVAVIRRHVRDIPVGVGFGIRDADSAPVSYTHLDVYKRQTKKCSELTAKNSASSVAA